MLFLQFIVLPHNYLLRNCYLQQDRQFFELQLAFIPRGGAAAQPFDATYRQA
jgi:hypothetical protein